MQRTATIRVLPTSLLALTALLAGCASPGKPASGWATAPATFEASATPLANAPVPRQDVMPDIDQIHPRTMVTFGLGIGDQTLEVNTGNPSNPTPVNARSTSSQRFRLRGEHFFQSGFGVFAEGFLGVADDIDEDLGASDSSYDSTGLFVAASFRATMDDDFRLPVRFGPFMRTTKQENASFTAGAIERSTVGVRLSPEPEVILMQRNDNGKISELSVFAEVAAGAGATDVEDDVDKEEGYSFTLDYEFGVRYRFGFGLLTSLSYVGSKDHVGT
ncbi:MAG: hypothetical protein KAI24_03095, partial [Planctomycetes bacterium]|nr:hypothetical protein [Planctomycetota bacterium]